MGEKINGVKYLLCVMATNHNPKLPRGVDTWRLGKLKRVSEVSATGGTSNPAPNSTDVRVYCNDVACRVMKRTF